MSQDLELNEIIALLEKLPPSDLAKTLALAGHRDYKVLGQVTRIKAAFQKYVPTDFSKLKTIVEDCLTIDDQVDWNRCSPYCQIPSVTLFEIKRLSKSGYPDQAKELAYTAIDAGESGLELLGDAAFWEMAISNIQEWVDDFGK